MRAEHACDGIYIYICNEPTLVHVTQWVVVVNFVAGGHQQLVVTPTNPHNREMGKNMPGARTKNVKILTIFFVSSKVAKALAKSYFSKFYLMGCIFECVCVCVRVKIRNEYTNTDTRQTLNGAYTK